MRVVRFVGLILAVAAAYFAVYIFYHRSLNNFFPQAVLDNLPVLYRFTRWLPEDLFTLALWLSALAAIGFGLVTPSWRGEMVEASAEAPTQKQSIRARRRRIGLGCIGFALVAASVDLGYLAFTGQETLIVQLVWAGALFVYLAGCALSSKRRHWSIPEVRVRPEQKWGYLLLILVGAGLLFTWQLLDIPAQVPEDVSEFGLWALAAVRGERTHLFIDAQPVLAPLAVMPTALAIWLSGDPLLGTRLAGVCAGLLTVFATWLVGCELFRRTPVTGEHDAQVEDEGQWVALVAAALVATSTVMVHFSRQPVYLEPVAWGVLSLWAWLRAVRTGDLLAFGLSGVLTGLAALLYQSGLIFVLMMPLWWVGVWLLQPAWFRRSQATIRMPGLVWLGGFFVTVAPLLAVWLRSPELLVARFQNAIFQNLWQMVSVFNPAVDQGARFGYAGAGLAAVIAPLWILAIGGLLLNLDRLVGWMLFTWCASGLLFGSALATQASDWHVLLPLLPALALTIALTLDRIRVTLMETAGAWLVQATTYLAISLVLWSALATWTDYVQWAQVNGDAASYMGRALRSLPPGRTPVLLLGQAGELIDKNSPVVRFFSGEQASNKPQLEFRVGEWPPSLPPASTVLIQPQDASVLSEIETRFPGGVVTVERDLRANPMLYLYALP